MQQSLIARRNREKIDTLDPEFAPNVKLWLLDKRVIEKNVLIVWGRRDEKLQAKLYADYKAGKGTRAAPPGESYHGWGQAIDFALCVYIKGEWWPTWDKMTHPDYRYVSEIAKSYGMTPISAELGHLQNAKYRTWRDIPKR